MTTAEYVGSARLRHRQPRWKRTFANAVAAFAAAVDHFRRWYRMRRAVRELRDLDDRMLSDIGLNRSTLHAAAREAHGLSKSSDHLR